MDHDQWDRVCIDEWRTDLHEPSGTSEVRIWKEDPAGGIWLFKTCRWQPEGYFDLEDWAEVAATIVGKHLGIPCASTRLAVESRKNGSLSRLIHDKSTHDFRDGKTLILDECGIEIADELDDQGNVYRRKGHSLETIRKALTNVKAPNTWRGHTDTKNNNAFSLFVGYLCFDFLVCNQDRHEENWAVLEPRIGDDRIVLADSFDHGSAFGFNLRPQKRAAILKDSAALESFCRKGRANRLEHVRGEPLTLLEAANLGLAMTTLEVENHWRERVSGLDLDQIRLEFEPAKEVFGPDPVEFALEVLRYNQGRFNRATTST